IEIGEASAVRDHVERALEARLSRGVQAKARLADVAFDDFDFVAEKRGEIRTVNFLKPIKRRRLFDDFFKAALRGSGAIAADQQGNLCDAGHFLKQVHKPDLANEPRDADEQKMLASERLADGQARDLRRAAEPLD